MALSTTVNMSKEKLLEAFKARELQSPPMPTLFKFYDCRRAKLCETRKVGEHSATLLDDDTRKPIYVLLKLELHSLAVSELSERNFLAKKEIFIKAKKRNDAVP